MLGRSGALPQGIQFCVCVNIRPFATLSLCLGQSGLGYFLF